MYLTFSYLKFESLFPGIKLCIEKFFIDIFSRFQRKSIEIFCAVNCFALFDNAYSHIYFSWELTILWLNKIIFVRIQAFYIKKRVTYIIIFIIRIIHNVYFVIILCFSLYCYFILFVQLFVMEKDIGRIYKHS